MIEMDTDPNPSAKSIGEAMATMLDVFENTLKAAPASTAIRYFDATLSYSDVARMSDGFAATLRGDGFSPGDRICLYMQNMPQFIICVLGTWKAGGIVVPINPMNRQRELELLLLDCRPWGMVTIPELKDEVLSRMSEGAYRPRRLFLADPRAFQSRNDARVIPAATPAIPREACLSTAFEMHSRSAEKLAVDRDSIAYIVYTSGTTGRPKGVMLLHSNIVSGAYISIGTFAMTRASCVLALAPLFHVTGLMAHMGAAMAAGCAVVLSYKFNAEVMIETIQAAGVTHMAGASTAYIAMMNVAGVSSTAMDTVQCVVTGGAPTAPAVLSRMATFFGVPPLNCFGLTETAIATHITPAGVSIPVDETTGALSVGLPNRGMASWIADEAGEPVPIGEPGEIVVTGPSLSPGYWENPEETKAAFTPRGFFTGDIGIMDTNGWYYVVDRKKDMISASGFKVWPREIEDVLYSHPAIREAAAIGVPDPYRGETVHAFVSLREGSVVDTTELDRFCRDQLAAYKRPRAIVILEELPKTTSGKVLRRDLRDR